MGRSVALGSGGLAAVDLVLSSGFLAFARHCGFLQAVEDAGLEVDALCGTSSGALVGSLWLAGLSARQIADELSAQAPLRFMRPRLGIWGGVFSLEPVLARLRGWLPARFEDLDRPLGVGVSPDGETAQLLTSGSLPEAVAASCAVPYLFAPVGVDGQTYKDGGAVDRLGLAAWRSFRGEGVPTLVHLVEHSFEALSTEPAKSSRPSSARRGRRNVK